jgi:ketosteroid isomerase-like protein
VHAICSPPSILDIQRWLSEFASCVRDERYDDALSLFAAEVVAFGTVAAHVVGLEALEREQWRKVWPVTRGFDFELSTLQVFGDGALVVVGVPWSSVGYDTSGNTFERSGRATIVLSSENGQRLVALHSHFSLDPR